MPRFHRWHFAAAALAAVITAAECRGIEMLTYYGDGSRIGLPSLEVPIDAYPGIPLRSDRIRARRRAMRMGPNSAVQIGPPGYARGITIRAMPMVEQPQPSSAAVSPAPVPPVPPEPMPLEPTPEKLRGEAETIPAPAPNR